MSLLFDECCRESSLRILKFDFENRDLQINIVRIEVRLPQGSDCGNESSVFSSNVDLENGMAKI